ncbi:VPS36 Vacuolar protein-sorting-associated protein 36 [Candida maltosa Xu316]
MASWLNIWQPVLINRSNRPILQDQEYNVYIKDNVGLYQGRTKILDHQNGRIYLTNKRLIYLDNEDLSKSIASELKYFKKSVLSVGYFRRSPKVTLYIKKNINDTNVDDINDAATNAKSIDWSILDNQREDSPALSLTPEPDNKCSKCTFINHPALKFCEMCGTALVRPDEPVIKKVSSTTKTTVNPLGLKLEGEETYTNDQPYIKISFRKGGETKFHEEVYRLIEEIKWKILESKGGVNQNAVKLLEPQVKKAQPLANKSVGIHALEQLGELQRKENERILSSSLDDLEQLMFKYQDLLKLSTSFNKLVIKSQDNLNLPVIPALNIKKNSSLYPQELSRHISEFLINFILTQRTSMISSQDLFAEYNRFLIRNQGFGTQLVTSSDFKKAIGLFDELKLPVILKQYTKSDIYVVSSRSTSNTYGEFIVDYLKNQEYEYKFMKLKQEMATGDEVMNDLYNAAGYGKTVSEISTQFNWSYNITIEELDKCVEEGLVVIDHHISGTFYYVNKFNFTVEEWDDSKEVANMKEKIIKEQQEITSTLREEYNEQHKNNLVNLNPDYHFFSDDSNKPDEDMESLVTTNMSETNSQSLNDLAGLQF